MEKKIMKFLFVFSLFCYHLPLEKGWTLHLNKSNPAYTTKIISQGMPNITKIPCSALL